MSDLTNPTILKLKDGPITISKELLETTLQNPVGNTFILIGVKSRNLAQLIPLREGFPVVKLIVKMVEDYGSLVRDLIQILKDHNLHSFYSTGFCVKITEAHCVHESYLFNGIKEKDDDDLSKLHKPSTPIDASTVAVINQRLNEIKGMLHAKITVIWDGHIE